VYQLGLLSEPRARLVAEHLKAHLDKMQVHPLENEGQTQ
jgi:hypothetical protein